MCPPQGTNDANRPDLSLFFRHRKGGVEERMDRMLWKIALVVVTIGGAERGGRAARGRPGVA